MPDPGQSESTIAGPITQQPVTPATPTPMQLIEALLFIGGAPLTAERAAKAIRGLDASQFAEIIQSLTRKYRQEGRPYSIQLEENGYLLKLGSQFKTVEERLYGLNRQARLSAAAIDVLSLVAYRQPISRDEIESIRGFDSSSLLRLLLRRALVKIVDRDESTGRKLLYATTQRFLELFQLASLEELPRTQDLERM
jgi:segregation and condensation protein B